MPCASQVEHGAYDFSAQAQAALARHHRAAVVRDCTARHAGARPSPCGELPAVLAHSWPPRARSVLDPREPALNHASAQLLPSAHGAAARCCLSRRGEGCDHRTAIDRPGPCPRSRASPTSLARDVALLRSSYRRPRTPKSSDVPNEHMSTEHRSACLALNWNPGSTPKTSPGVEGVKLASPPARRRLSAERF